MINIENNDKKHPETNEEKGLIDIAKMDVQCHLLIKDKDTKEVFVNKRG
jgi:hypothetical protein